MPATARQKRFMRLVKARQHGHNVGGPKVAEAAGSMREGSVQEFIDSPTKPPVRSKEAMRKRMRGEK